MRVLGFFGSVLSQAHPMQNGISGRKADTVVSIRTWDSRLFQRDRSAHSLAE